MNEQIHSKKYIKNMLLVICIVFSFYIGNVYGSFNKGYEIKEVTYELISVQNEYQTLKAKYDTIKEEYYYIESERNTYLYWYETAQQQVIELEFRVKELEDMLSLNQ
jgi:hypothetical protein